MSPYLYDCASDTTTINKTPNSGVAFLMRGGCGPSVRFFIPVLVLLNWTKGTIRRSEAGVQNSAKKPGNKLVRSRCRNENQTCDSNNCNSRWSGVTGLCPATIGYLSCA